MIKFLKKRYCTTWEMAKTANARSLSDSNTSCDISTLMEVWAIWIQRPGVELHSATNWLYDFR